MTQREYDFTQNDFDQIRALILKHSGINLGEHKVDMVYGRIARRLRKLGLSKTKDYIELVRQDTAEATQFVNALTTNLTYFFREQHHFEFLKETLLSEVKEKRLADKKLRIWSAGCSSGEEPYSIAMTIQPFVSSHASWDIKILATDLDTQILSKAQQGVYQEERVGKLEKSQIKYGFSYSSNTNQFKIKDKFSEMISFKKLNLMSSWPMKGKFDVIFCRNVLIYFDRETQDKLIGRFYELLNPWGYLILGHSESLGAQANKFSAIGRTVFKRH